MPFSSFGLHPLLLRGVKELGFTRPTPIQLQAIPPAMEGRDVLACAATGSGKTAAFGLPIVHRLMDKPRRTTRALILTPTRELAAQIQSHLEELAVHTPITGFAVFGGVGMGPQEHAFRAGVDVMVATPGRLLDHFRQSYATLARSGDPGAGRGRPDARHGLPARHPPRAAAPSAAPPDPVLLGHHARRRSPGSTRELLKDPATVNLHRRPVPAAGITQAVYPVGQPLKSALLLALLCAGAT